MVKETDTGDIINEVKIYLDIDWKFDEEHFGHVAKKKDIIVNLIYYPDWNVWIDAMFWTVFCTWHNGFEVDLRNIPRTKRETLTLNALRNRQISAALESPVFIFWIEGIPRTMTHQIVRHEHSGMSFNQQSLRVTPCHHANIRVPDSLTGKEMISYNNKYNDDRKFYVDAIKRGIPLEQARNDMPMGTCTNLVMRGNIKDLKNYFRARTMSLTQDEHTYIACRIAKELKDECSKFYDNFIKNENLEILMDKYLNG